MIFDIYHISAPFVKLCGCRFLYFFSLCAVKNEAVFLLLEHSSLRGVKLKKHVKKHEILALNPYYKRSNWKTWPSQIFSEALTFNLWKNKKKMLPKFTGMEENGILFTPYSFIKNLQQIHLRESHMKFTGKIHVIKIMWLDWSKQKNIQFSVNSSRKFICQYQARRPASKQALGL